MAESKDEAAGVLQLLKTSDEPSAADVARVRAAVWARVGLAGAVTTAVATGVHGLGHGAEAALNVAANGSSALNAASGAGSVGSSLATGAAAGAKAAWVVTVTKVGLAVALLGAGGWYGARSLSSTAGSQLAAASAPEAPQTSKSHAEPSRARIVPAPSVAPAAGLRDEGSTMQVTPRARAAASSDTLDTEVALLGEAQRALAAGQYSVALASLDKHAARFPRGALSSEREASRAIALCRSGALSRGQKLAQRYVTQHASSPLCTRVRAACKLTE